MCNKSLINLHIISEPKKGRYVMDINPHIIAKAKDGDREAFGKLYESIANDLYKLALYMLGNKEDAEDAVSETFIEAFKGIKNLRNDSSFKPWIMRILSIRCKRKIGGYVKEKTNVDIAECLDISAQDNSEQTVMLWDALNSLSAEEREIIILSVVYGYKIKEISEIKDLPQGTVSSKIHRTMKKLQKLLS